MPEYFEANVEIKNDSDCFLYVSTKKPADTSFILILPNTCEKFIANESGN